MLAALIWAPTSCTKQEPATSPVTEAPRLPGTQFNSPLELWVYVQIKRTDGPQFVECTPSETALKIPACHDWWVEPKGDTTPQMLADSIRAGAISRVELSEATDSDLALLRGLTGLRKLSLRP